MSDEWRSAAHRDLVKALGDETALGDISGGAWLESIEWADAIERVRSQRFPDIPPAEAFRAVGLTLGERYLGSPTGQVLLQSLQLVPLERVFTNLVPAMAQRLRPGFSWLWEPGVSGGVLRVRGKRVTPATVTLGFFEAMLKGFAQSAKVQLGAEGPDELQLVFSW